MGRKYPSEVAEKRQAKRSERQRWREQVAGYEVELTPDDLDGGYVVQCVDMPGCISQGDTVDEALENIADAIQGVLRAQALAADPDFVREHLAFSANYDLDAEPGLTVDEFAERYLPKR